MYVEGCVCGQTGGSELLGRALGCEPRDGNLICFFVFLFAFAKFPAAGWRTLGSVGTENGDQLEAETAGIGACRNKSGHAVSLATEHRFSQRWDQGF